MTEREWMECTDPQAMLILIQGKVSDRKLRLFACAYCRRIRHLFVHNDSLQSIEIGESFADDSATDEELRIAEELAILAGDDASWRSMYDAAIAWAAAAPVQKSGFYAAEYAVYEMQSLFAENESKCEAERTAQCLLLRAIIGNFSGPVSLVSSWLTPTVTTLAQAAYEERIMPSGELDLDRLAVLSDALEEAGCDNGDILAHLRSPGPHVRGCWAVDLLLGKE